MKRSIFFQFFPPPQFLQMPAVGLDISDRSLHFVELVEKGKGPRVGRFGERAIPRGIIELGEVKKPAELRAILATLHKEYEITFVAVALPEERAYLFDLELPAVKRSEIRGSIELLLEEHIPLRASEVLFDYRIERETDTLTRVSVSAVPRSLVDGYLEAFAESGIIPVFFEIETHSLARSVIPRGDMRSFLVVDLGRTRTGLTIVSGGAVEFTSTAALGGATITEMVEKHLGVSNDEAEKLKKEKGLACAPAGSELARDLSASLALLLNEIRKDYTYWQTHPDSYGKARPSLGKIYLCGGDANLPGFAEYIARGFDIPVEVANAFVNAISLDAYIPEINFSDSLRYATAIGLALRNPEMENTPNLLPREEKRKNRAEYLLRLSTVALCAILFLVIANFALLAPSYMRASSKKSTAEARITASTGMIASEREEDEKDANARIRDLNKKLSVLSSGAGGVATQTLPSQMIASILALKTAAIKIQNIAYDATSERARYVISGRALDRESLAQFTDKLKKSTLFTKIELPISSYVKSTNIEFSLVLETSSSAKQASLSQ